MITVKYSLSITMKSRGRWISPVCIRRFNDSKTDVWRQEFLEEIRETCQDLFTLFDVNDEFDVYMYDIKNPNNDPVNAKRNYVYCAYEQEI